MWSNGEPAVPDLPWRQGRPPDPDAQYLALLTYLPLRRFWTLPAFMRFVLAVQGQLAGAAGLLGYTLRAWPFSRRFWTLSVWDDEAALRQFVVAQPHRDVMGKLRGRMGATSFTRWQVRGSDLPLTWEDAMEHAMEHGGHD